MSPPKGVTNLTRSDLTANTKLTLWDRRAEQGGEERLQSSSVWEPTCNWNTTQFPT